MHSKNRFTVLLGGFYCVFFLALRCIIVENITILIDYTLMEISSTAFTTRLLIDKIRLRFSALVIIIAACVYYFSSRYIAADVYYSRFIWILRIFVLSINLLIYAGSYFMLLLGWDGLGITSFALIIYYQRNSSLGAGFITLLVNRLGDVLIICSIFIIVWIGQFNLYIYRASFMGLRFLWILASFTKSAQYPFRAWLPEAIAAPTPVRALVHSSTLVTAGIYLITRFSIHSNLSPEMLCVIAFIGSLTCLLGGSCALFENDVKKIVALSTLRQLGLMIYSLSLGIPSITLFHLYIHALFKAILFLCVGLVLIMSYGNQDMRLIGGVLNKAPILSIFFNLRAFCLMGIPFINAYYTKHTILEVICSTPLNILSFLGIYIGRIFSAAYICRLIFSLNWGNPSMSLFTNPVGWSIYMPLFILGIRRLIRGKLFISYELSYLKYSFLPTYYNWLVSLTALVGLIIGVNIKGPKNRRIITTLWFIHPFKMSLIKLLGLIQKCRWQLEGIWLRPRSLGKRLVVRSKNLLKVFWWPSPELGISYRVLGVIIIVLSLCKYLL